MNTTTVGTNMSLLEEFKNKKLASESAEKELATFVNQHSKALLTHVCKELKSINGMNKLVLKGYTPRFNDGDSCTHSSCTYYNKRYDFQEIAEDDTYDFAEFIGIPDDFEGEPYEWGGLKNVNTYDDADYSTIRYYVQLADYLAGQIYDTNYIVYIDFTEDEPTLIDHEYDCGH